MAADSDGSENGSTHNAPMEKVMQRKNSTCQTFFGKIRHYDNVRYLEWAFLSVALLSSAISLGITAERMVSRFHSDTPDFTFALLLTANIVFCIYYSVRGVFQEQPYDIIVFIITNIIVIVYVVLNYVERSGGDLKLIRLVCTCVLGSINVILGVKVSYDYSISNNLVFRIVGGLPDMQRICRLFFMCGSLLSFDLQFQVNILILTFKKGTDIEQLETPIIFVIICTVIEIPWILIGYLALRRESNLLCYVFLGTCWISPSNIIYKFVFTSSWTDPQDILYVSTFAAGTIALVIRIVLVAFIIIACFNFGKGYKDKSKKIFEIPRKPLSFLYKLFNTGVRLSKSGGLPSLR